MLLVLAAWPLGVLAVATTITRNEQSAVTERGEGGPETSLLPFETIQLNDSTIANLNDLYPDDAKIFHFANTSSAGPSVVPETGCKAFPDESHWPSQDQWSLLANLTEEALITGEPSAAVCYEDWPQYDAGDCASVTGKWGSPKFQSYDPTGIDWPLLEGLSCLPPNFTRPDATCTLGGLPSYVMNVTDVEKIQLAVNFARNLKLRLVVKNKGHDFNAKSTGAGALTVWTTYLQDIVYLGEEYSYGTGHIGPAFKVGAGVEAIQVYEAADALGLQVVGGIARTVGLAGGYSAAGGHSPLMGLYGMAADQILSLEVVLPNGRFVHVDSEHNPDLFFALRGGGGSTYGIVTSMVIAAYPKQPVTTVTYSFGTSQGIDIETFWAGVNAFWATFPTNADAGLYSYWYIICPDKETCTFLMLPQWANNFSAAELRPLNQPLLDDLNSLGIQPANITYAEYPGLLDAFTTTFPDSAEGVGTWNAHTASRLFPRSNWDDPDTLSEQSSAIRRAVEVNGLMIGYNFKPADNPRVNQTNAVTSAWRNTLFHAMTAATFNTTATPEDIAAASRDLVELLQPWRDASPGAGAYMNEADVNEPGWQQAFYGDNYGYLYELKQRYDPWGLFYAPTAVGSEDWYVTGQLEYYPTQNGQLCLSA
ncbi:restculine oxidase precursor [Diaporthe eres]|nr:restculine oxidase precursor [Diaporthe eres]